MQMHSVELRTRSPWGAIPPLLLALFGGRQRAAHADQIGWNICKERGAFDHPRRFQEDMIGKHMVPRPRECHNGIVHT